MSIFPYIPEVVWAIINFLVLFLILKKFLFGPILGMMEQRRKEIAENLTKADEAQREAEKLRQEYLDQMAAARKEAQDIINQANKAGDSARA
ncbi:MAG: F0F1 ATP synthase subunit B, partial [Firmicutes bacterium]|nr:F0F1 ATP synthase subunit B [Bacillota bacterium]